MGVKYVQKKGLLNGLHCTTDQENKPVENKNRGKLTEGRGFKKTTPREGIGLGGGL